MSKKIGRPRVPKSKAQAVLYGARLSREKARIVNQNLADTGQTPSEVIKEKLDEVAQLRWTVPKWKYEDLHGKWVQFRLKVLKGDALKPFEGIGKFSVVRHSSDVTKLAIRIQIILPEGQGRHETVFDLGQSPVDAIERHPQPKVADFRCFQPD